MQVWPFAPLSEMTEVLEWKTDVIRSQSAEQRIALLEAPRRSYSLQHLLDAQHYASAQEMVREAEAFRVPDWTQVVRLDAVAPGSEVVIPFDAQCLDFVQGEQAILWRAPGAWEVIDIAAVSAGGITAAVDRQWGAVRLMPLRAAIAPDGMTAQRVTRHWASVSIRLDITSNRDQGASTYSQYRGHDVMTDCPKLAGGSLDEGVSWPAEIIDSQLGRVDVIRARTMPDVVCTMRWRVYGHCDHARLRAWLHSRRGRQKAFWMSTRGADFIPATDIGALAITLTVGALPGLQALAREAFDIELATHAGDIFRRQVLSWFTDSDGRIVLELAEPLGVDVQADDVRRISWLRCVRFNADRIELVHRAAAGVQVAVQCIEVPVP